MYKGIEMTSLDNYIFDTLPYNEEIDLNEVRQIELNLREYKKGYEKTGISFQDAFKFLDWVTYNARSFATRNIPESAMTAPLAGLCGPTQNLNKTLLSKIGLDVRPFNMGECVGNLPMSKEDINRLNNGFLSTYVRHAVCSVRLPINDNGKTSIHTYLLDPTFRQFCLKENCNKDVYMDINRVSKGHVAPHPGYFLSEDYLKECGADKDLIEKSKYIAEVLINRGYMELTEENAKIYGDAFARAGMRKEFSDYKLEMTGKDYINKFDNMRVSFVGDIDENYTKTPMEIEDKKSILDRIKYFFSNIKKLRIQKRLPEAVQKSYSVDNTENTKENRKEMLDKYNVKINHNIVLDRNDNANINRNIENDDYLK